MEEWLPWAATCVKCRFSTVILLKLHDPGRPRLPVRMACGSVPIVDRASVTIELVAVEDPATREAARDLIAEYLRWIAGIAAGRYGLSFDVDAMVASDLEDRSKFFPPDGRFYVIRREASYVGVGCLKRITPSVAEIQRMYVQPHVRGVGAGRLLLQQLLSDARAIGYEAVRLESLKVLSAAHALYKSAGFAEITPYADNSMAQYQPGDTLDRYRASAVFMELRLGPERDAGDSPTPAG